MVVLLNAYGGVLDAKQQAAFESFHRDGGGFVGIRDRSRRPVDCPGL